MSNNEWWAATRAREQQFDAIVRPAVSATEIAIAEATNAAKVWGSHFGATGIDPKHLVVYFVLPTRAEVQRFKESEAWASIKANLLSILNAAGYPTSTLQEHWVGLFSEQECREEANGNWYHFFK
jgi:hypothetical protein